MSFYLGKYVSLTWQFCLDAPAKSSQQTLVELLGSRKSTWKALPCGTDSHVDFMLLLPSGLGNQHFFAYSSGSVAAICFPDGKALTLLSSYVTCLSHERSQPGGGSGPLEDMLGSAILSLDMDEGKRVQARIGIFRY